MMKKGKGRLVLKAGGELYQRQIHRYMYILIICTCKAGQICSIYMYLLFFSLSYIYTHTQRHTYIFNITFVSTLNKFSLFFFIQIAVYYLPSFPSYFPYRPYCRYLVHNIQRTCYRNHYNPVLIRD